MPVPVWRIPEYRRVLLGTFVMSLAVQAERLAVSWFVLLQTDSVFLTAVSFAIRKVPGSLMAPLAGDLSDRWPRSRLLSATALYNSAIALTFAWLSLYDFEQLWAVFALAALSGIGRSFEVPATQGLITDIVPREMTLQAIALHGTAMRTMTAVGGLLWAAFVVEMFGFTFNALMPSFARNVLDLGADGLGQLTFAAGLGSVLGVATLAAASGFPRKGLLFIGITIAYGVFLVAFASSDFFLLSLTLLIGVGAAAGMFDTIQMTLLQQHVPDDARGRAIGGWVFAINFAWIGQMTLGYIAESVGVEFALAGAGGLVVVTGLAIFFLSPRLRQV